MASPKGINWTRTRDWKHLPHISAVYVIFLKDKPFYVGKAVNLYRRFACHQIDIRRICYRSFDGDPADIVVAFRPTCQCCCGKLEKKLICKLRPAHNIVFNRGGKA